MESQSSNDPSQHSRRPRKRECPVCYSTLITPIYQCYNGHLICSKCLLRLDTCPVCRTPYPFGQTIRAREFEDLIQEFMVQCTYKDQGCPMILDVEDVQEHEATCDFQFMTSCTWCGLRLAGKLMGQHFTKVHKMTGVEEYKFGQVVDISQSCFPWEFKHSLVQWGTHYLFCDSYKFYIKTEIHSGGKFIRWNVTFDHDNDDDAPPVSTRSKLKVVIKLTRRESENIVSTAQWTGYPISRTRDRGFGENSFSIPLQQLECYSLCTSHEEVDLRHAFPTVWNFNWTVSIRIFQEPTTTTLDNKTLNDDDDEGLSGDCWTLRSSTVYSPRYEYLLAAFFPCFDYPCPYRGLREFRNWTISAALTLPFIYWLVKNTKLVPNGSRLVLESTFLLPKDEQVSPMSIASTVMKTDENPVGNTKVGNLLLTSATIGGLLGATVWKLLHWFRRPL